MSNPALAFGALAKPSRGDRLRAQEQDTRTSSRALTDLYRYVYKRDHYKCVACGRPVVVGSTNALKRAHPHHIVPRSRAATAEKHTKANICCVCPFCHSDIHEKRLIITGNAERQLTIRRTT